MKLKIITPESILYDGEVKSVNLPGKYGSFSILKNHAPLITILKKGVLSYTTTEDTSDINIEGGFVEVNNNTVTICLELTN